MDEALFQLVRSAGFVVAVVFATALQRIAPHTKLRGSWRLNGALWLVNAGVMGAVCGACACTVARWTAVAGIGLFNQVVLPPLLQGLLTVLVLDVVSYGWHRANHRIPFLWRFHQVHHSDHTFTVSTAARFHPGELLLSLPVRLSAVVLLGASAVDVVLFESLFAIANFVEHGNIHLSPPVNRRLARLCITPALHRRHHSAQRDELNRNFGTIFVLWDRLLGTYKESRAADRVVTGLPYDADARTLGNALLLPITVAHGLDRGPI